jgi:hypothetical protein
VSNREAGNWLQGFNFYTRESECPDNYLLWAGLSAISAALQGRVYTKWGYFVYNPSLYIILVGRSGLRKSTSIRFAKTFMRNVGVRHASEAITKEALIQQMQRPTAGGVDSMSITVGEFASFIAPSGLRMIEFLTDIYDCDPPWEYTTKGGGTDVIENPYLTLLGGVVPDWISQEFTEAFTKLGFASRTLFIYERELRFRKAYPKVSEEMMEMSIRLTNDLEQIAGLQGEYVWTRDALDWWEDWYENRFPLESLDYRLEGYLERKPTQIVKVSMLLAAAENNDMILDIKHFEAARDLITALEPRMVEAFASVGRNPYANDMERIANDIHHAGVLSKGELIRRNTHAMSKVMLDELLENLILMGEVVTDTDGKELFYVSTERKK